MNLPTFEEYAAQMRKDGYPDTVVRVWKSATISDTHQHPFAAKALMVEGQMWLTQKGETRHLVRGDTFELAPNERHAERYGGGGATYWVGRRNP